MDGNNGFVWHFERLGGLDQVTLRTSDELRRLGELNPKLWVALSCPAKGLEFDERTLRLVDTDNDGRIRVPEIQEAVRWLTERLADPQSMVDAGPDLPLDAIAATPEGAVLREAAKTILASLDKPDSDAITRADVTGALDKASQSNFNGDGVLPPLPDYGTEEAAFIVDAMTVVGAVEDVSGKLGVNKAIVTAFMATLKDWQDWREAVARSSAPIGADSTQAWELLSEMEDKIDDYFLRCDLAAFAPPPEKQEETVTPPDHGLLDASALEDLPLARVSAGRPLSLSEGVNPAWRDRMERFGSLIAPLLAVPGRMTRDDWETIKKNFAPYRAALTRKPGKNQAVVTAPPTGGVDGLGEERVREILSGDVAAKVLALVQQDDDAPASKEIADLERLVLYHAHLYRLLMNFVSFHDFYTMSHKAAFQYGTLYLDGRSCRLCLPVRDVDAHAKLASHSELCLVYCDCKRKKDAPDEAEAMTIVAAVTAGEADLLIEGRNGVFFDTQDQDWDATVTKVVSNPITLRQAIWDPYRRFGRLVGDQITKLASARQDALTDKLAKNAQDAVSGNLAKQPFDIGKSVGIFAAIGLALGALGTALATMARALFSLEWWQFPLVFLAVFLIISGPSLVLAWLKLRKRSLGPLLEASGWAVNSTVPINFTLGKRLTGVAELPPNAERCSDDPLHVRKRWPGYLAALLIVCALLGAGLWYYRVAIPWPWSTSDKTEPANARNAAAQSVSEQQAAEAAKTTAEDARSEPARATR